MPFHLFKANQQHSTVVGLVLWLALEGSNGSLETVLIRLQCNRLTLPNTTRIWKDLCQKQIISNKVFICESASGTKAAIEYKSEEQITIDVRVPKYPLNFSRLCIITRIYLQ